MQDIRDQIREYDPDFVYDPERARRPGIDSLQDGTYTFVITDAASALVGDDKMPVVRLGLKVEGSDDRVEYTYWLNNQVSINILGQDLATLKIDSPQWTGRRNFSDELHKVLVSGVLIGRRFKAKKVTQTVHGKDHHRFYINLGFGPVAAASAEDELFSPSNTTSIDLSDVPF